MISKIHLVNGGAWGIRDDEQVSSLVNDSVTDKMKTLAAQASQRIALQKKKDEEREKRRKERESKEKEDYARMERRLNLIKKKALQNIIISKSDRPTTPTGRMSGRESVAKNINRWTIKLAPESVIDLQKFKEKRKSDREEHEKERSSTKKISAEKSAFKPYTACSLKYHGAHSVIEKRRPSSAGHIPSNKAQAEVMAMTKPALDAIKRRTSTLSPKTVSPLNLELDTIASSEHDPFSPMHLSASPTHKFDREGHAFGKGADILGGLMIGLEASPAAAPKRPSGFSSTKQGSTPRARRVSAGAKSMRSARDSYGANKEVMTFDHNFTSFNANLHEQLEKEMQEMHLREEEEHQEKLREMHASDEEDDDDEEEYKGGENDKMFAGGSGGGEAIGFGHIVEDATFVKEAQEVGITVVLSPKGDAKTLNDANDDEEDNYYGDEDFEEEDPLEKSKIVKADDDDDDYGDEDFEQEDDIDLP